MDNKKQEREIVYTKYAELYDSTVKNAIERVFKPSFRKGFYVSTIVLKPGEDIWIVEFKRKHNFNR